MKGCTTMTTKQKVSKRCVQKTIRVEPATDQKLEEISEKLGMTQAEFVNVCINIGINFYSCIVE